MIEYFKTFDPLSVFGLEVPYYVDGIISHNHKFFTFTLGDLVFVMYSPTLSSFEIAIDEDEACYLIEEELKRLLKIPNESSNFNILDEQQSLLNELQIQENLNIDKKTSLRVEYRLGDNCNLICYDSKIKLEFYETKPTHSRHLLFDQIQMFFNKVPILNNIKLNDVSNNAWWSVLWTPTKSGKPQTANTSFLTYYQFKYQESDNFFTKIYNKNNEIPIICVLPIKFEETMWLNLINKSKFMIDNLLGLDGLSYHCFESLKNIKDKSIVKLLVIIFLVECVRLCF